MCTLALKVALILLYKNTQYTDNKHLTYFRTSNNGPSLSDINTKASNYNGKLFDSIIVSCYLALAL